MNTKNNKRYKNSSEKIEQAFLSLIKSKNYEEITISDICKEAKINRSTFYAHYDDINDLIIKIEAKFAHGLSLIFNFGLRCDNQAFIEMFNFVKENKIFYKAFLQIPYTTLAEKNIKNKILSNLKENSQVKEEFNEIDILYRSNFFGAGMKAICCIWIERDCKESPQQMADIIYKEYTNRKSYI